MIIIVDEKNIQVEGKDFDQVYDALNEAILNSEKIFSHLLIDGEEVYDGMEVYIEDNLNEIEKIEAIMATDEEFINDILVSTLDYIDNAIPIIKKLSESFIEGKSNDVWMELHDLSGGLYWILETCNQIQMDEKLNDILSKEDSWKSYTESNVEITEILEELDEAIEDEDSTAIGDILYYRIVEIFEKMVVELKDILSL